MKDTCSKTKKKSAGPVIKEIEICSINCDGDVARFVENNGEVVREYWKAREKHPKFVDHFCPLTCATYEPELHWHRARLEVAVKQKNAMFQHILETEMYEALDAYVHGKLAHAKQELAKCAAVCIRAMEMIEEQMNRKGEPHA